MLLPTIRCLAGRHLSGDKYPFPHCCAGPCVSTAFKPVSHPGTSPGHKTVLTISCCKSLCDTTPWSMSSSWLRTSKLLSLKSRRCFHIFRGGGGGVLQWFIKVSVASAATSIICFTGVAAGLQMVPPCCGCSAVRYSSPLPGTWGKGSVLTDKVSVNDYVCLRCSVQSWIFLHTWFLGRKVARVKDPVFWFLGYLWDLHNAT